MVSLLFDDDSGGMGGRGALSAASIVSLLFDAENCVVWGGASTVSLRRGEGRTGRAGSSAAVGLSSVVATDC